MLNIAPDLRVNDIKAVQKRNAFLMRSYIQFPGDKPKHTKAFYAERLKTAVCGNFMGLQKRPNGLSSP